MERESTEREHEYKGQGMEMDLEHKRLVGAVKLSQTREAAKAKNANGKTVH
jgi:predicted FMN-binding regulatory protein PaiB